MFLCDGVQARSVSIDAPADEEDNLDARRLTVTYWYPQLTEPTE